MTWDLDNEKESDMIGREMSVLGSGNSMCKGPEAICFRNAEEAYLARTGPGAPGMVLWI